MMHLESSTRRLRRPIADLDAWEQPSLQLGRQLGTTVSPAEAWPRLFNHTTRFGVFFEFCNLFFKFFKIQKQKRQTRHPGKTGAFGSVRTLQTAHQERQHVNEGLAGAWHAARTAGPVR